MNCAACGKSLSDDARDKIFRVGNKNVCSMKCLRSMKKRSETLCVQT